MLCCGYALLVLRVFDWRAATAHRLGMAPEAVLKTGVAMHVALMQVCDG